MSNEKYEILKDKQLIYAEDDCGVAESLGEILSYYFAEVRHVHHGGEAIALFESGFGDVVISDVMMPHVDGLELARYFHETQSSIPLVIISANSNFELVRSYIKYKVVDYILKPIFKKQIFEILDGLALRFQEGNFLVWKISTNISYYQQKKSISNHGTEIALGKFEAGVLELLLQNRGSIVSKEEIYYQIYKDKDVGENSLKNLISKLRKKMGVDIILAIRDQGYILLP